MASATSPDINSLNNAPQGFRQGGSGFTAFYWGNTLIAFAQSVAHQSPKPVAEPVPIQPLDCPYPLQILVPAAIGAGTLQLSLFEMYNQKVWDNIMNLTDTKIDNAGAGTRGFYDDLAQIFLRLSAIPAAKAISCAKIVYPPNTGTRPTPTVQGYADIYHRCMITDIRDDETIQVGTIEVVKSVTVMYCYMTRVYQTGANFNVTNLPFGKNPA